MAFTPTPVADMHVLVQIELTGKTLYYADESMSMSDGNFYDGRLDVSTLQRAFSSFTAPKQRESTLTITLKDNDLAVRKLLEDYTWGNRHVKVYIGKGRNLSDYSIDFHGIVKFPGGIGFDRNEVRIKLRDIRNKDKVVLPANKFWISNYPNLEDGEEAKPIPIVYGNWGNTPIPATCIDTTTNQFKIADHAITSLSQVFVNGEPVSFSDKNLTEATFKISAYTPGTDVVTVSCTGYFIDNPVWVLKHILQIYVEVSSSDIDGDSFNELEGELSGIHVRRYIAEEISSETLIEELAIENMFDLFIANDKYTVRSRMPKVIIDRSFDDITIMPGTLSVESDPESLYSNRIKCNYKYDPVNEEYLEFTQEDNSAEQTNVKQVISRTINFNWLYEYDAVHAVAAHLILLYSHEIDVIRFTALGDGILTQLADRAGLTFAHYNNRPLHVREISKHFNTMSCTIFGYDSIKHVLPGYWTDDDAPNYDDATPEQKALMGFWTDDDGLAKPGDEKSKVSHWW